MICLMTEHAELSKYYKRKDSKREQRAHTLTLREYESLIEYLSVILNIPSSNQATEIRIQNTSNFEVV